MKLRRVLGLPAVVFIVVGFTIGGGVFVFTGIVFNITRQALPLAYALAAIPVFMGMMPIAMLGSAIPVTGGNYIYPSRMVSPGLAFVGIWVYALASFFGQIPLYALGCTEYARIFFPNLSPVAFAVAIVTFFFLINLLGIRLAAQIQGILVIVLVAALVSYAATGFSDIRLENFSPLFEKGMGNLLLGTALLTFTYFGANGIIELGGEIVNPGRVIPRAFFIAFPIIALIYIAVAVVTVGVLHMDAAVTAAEPLIQVSRQTSGKAGFLFFVLGGAVLALLTTLNALFIVGTKSLLTITADGVLPEELGALHPRFRTPYRLLLIIWVFSVLGIVSGFSLETFAAYAALGTLIIFFPVNIAAIRLPGRYPGRYRTAPFKLNGFWLWACPAAGLAMVLFFGVIILYNLRSPLKIGCFLLFIATGVAYYLIRKAQLARKGIYLVQQIKQKDDWNE
ncbi:MAG: amino acid permease [Thermodesulfobacteriota bacterium]